MTDPEPNDGSGVAGLLGDLAARSATGCLAVTDDDGQEAEVWLRDGRIYSVAVPGPRPMLGVRLMSTGLVTPEVLALALERQRHERPARRLGEVLVALGVVEPEVVEAFLIQQQADMVADLLVRTPSASEFREGESTTAGLSQPVDAAVLVAQARDRADAWSEIVDGVGGPDVVPVLATRPDGSADVVLGPSDWALLCKVDGRRSLRALAADCGFTVIEAGQILAGLHAAGLVDCGPEDTAFVARPAAPEPWVSDLAAVTAALSAVLARSSGRDGVEALAAHPVPPPRPLPPPTATAPSLDPPVPPALPDPPVPPASPDPPVPPAEEDPLGEALSAVLAAASEDPRPVAPADADGTVVLDGDADARPLEPADTAALMRELSSLSAASDPEPDDDPTRPAPTRPAEGKGEPRRRRRGLFGR